MGKLNPYDKVAKKAAKFIEDRQKKSRQAAIDKKRGVSSEDFFHRLVDLLLFLGLPNEYLFNYTVNGNLRHYASISYFLHVSLLLNLVSWSISTF